jgi:SAM-dependent methyltransferase
VTTDPPPSLQAIRAWFDRTYRDQGLAYLRPAEFYSIFMEWLDVRPGHRLLDVGCGPGLLLGQAVERGAAAWGVDVSATALVLARRLVPRARVCAGNAEALGFADHVFNHVTCIGTFEHFPDGDHALAELRRVLKPDGRLCVMVPNSRTLKWQLESRLGVHDERAATLEHWREVFLGSRFTIDRIHRDEWPRYRRRRLFRRGGSGFAAAARRARHLAPLRFANQFVFLLRP